MITTQLNISTGQLWLIAFAFLIAFAAASHAAINKRNSRSAFAWVSAILLYPAFFASIYLLFDWIGVLVLSPVIIAAGYVFFGINNLQRKIQSTQIQKSNTRFPSNIGQPQIDQQLLEISKWKNLIETGNNLGYSPLEKNEIKVLRSGNTAYPSMLDKINNAKISITLFSYIFDFDHTGKAFTEALISAQKRGVEVRVLIDAVGSNKDITSVLYELRKHKVKAEAFLPVLLKSRYSFLRNHRKILVIDGQIAFTGGLNIADLYWSKHAGKRFVEDMHFMISGHSVQHIQKIFTNDWHFTTNEKLEHTTWFPESTYTPNQDSFYSRVIADGPSYDDERLRWHFLSAVNHATSSIQIASPYFLPDYSLITALCAASIRGIKVEILTSEKSDHKIIEWATIGNITELVSNNCRVFLKAGNFDHSKFLVIDNEYASIGSANWDARSLRLNYELNLECYCPELAMNLKEIFEEKKKQSHELTLEQLNSRPYPIKLRDGFARLSCPYL